MKSVFITIIAILISTNAISDTRTRTGKIVAIRAHTDYWGSDSWVQLEGIANVLDCGQGNSAGAGELTYIVIPSTETNMYSMLLAAYMASKSVQIQIDSAPAKKLHGLCVANYATLI